jgi:hypothetical protein
MFMVLFCVDIDDWVASIIIMVRWWQVPVIVFPLVHVCKQGKLTILCQRKFTSSHKIIYIY